MLEELSRLKDEREYLRDKINELEVYSKNKTITDSYRVINGFKECY
jgi:hypothetical protein